MNRATSFAALAAVLLAVEARAQDQATTLAALAARADVVVRAQVLAATDPSPDWHRLTFATLELLRGTLPPQFELLEPAGACCGRSLFALTVGDQRLLFLRRTGSLLHPLGGARGVLGADAETLAATTALLGAGSDAAQKLLLLAQLGATDPRIADDAAHALAALPTLLLDRTQRQTVATALANAVEQRSPRAVALVDVAVRCADADLVDAVLPVYLHTPHADQARLLRLGLARCDAALLTERLPRFVPRDRCTALRCAELLTSLPDATAAASMTAMLRGAPHAEAQLELCIGLLDRGMHPPQLAPHVPPAVLQFALQRRASPPRFRNVSPFGR